MAANGDNSEADSLLDHANTLWHNYIKNWILNSIGGIWPEGSQYSYQTLYFLFALTESERTAIGADVWASDTDIKPFIKNCIQSTIWITPPSNDHIVVYYDQEDVNAHYWNRRSGCVALLGSLAEHLGLSNEAAYSRYWIGDVVQDIGYELNLWKLFLWYDSQAVHTNYFQQQLPKVHFSEGQDWMFLRTHWANQGTFSTFYAPWTNVDHQFADGGHFNIWRNVRISDNNALTSLTGLEGLTSIAGSVWIDFNENLTSLSGLEYVTYIDGFLGKTGKMAIQVSSPKSKIDISRIPKGLYIVEVIANHGIIRSKLIIE